MVQKHISHLFIANRKPAMKITLRKIVCSVFKYNDRLAKTFVNCLYKTPLCDFMNKLYLFKP